MGHEDQRLFLVHTSSILHYALVGALGVHYGSFLVTWKVDDVVIILPQGTLQHNITKYYM
jgi:hypothetical protein